MLLWLCILGGAVFVEAALKLTVANWTNIVTNVPVDISWTGNNGTVDVILENGTTSNPFVVNIIASSISSNSYLWTPGSFAIVGDSFFINVTDAAGDTALGGKFVVQASSSSSSSSKTSSTAIIHSTTSSTHQSTTTTRAVSTSKSTSTAASPTPNANGSLNGLSTGAKIGIGVGIGVGAYVLGILFAMAVIWRRKYKAVVANRGDTVAGNGDAQGIEKPELAGSAVLPEMGDGRTSKSSGEGSEEGQREGGEDGPIEPQELEVEEVRHELP